MRVNHHTQVIIASIIMLAILISGCRKTVTEPTPEASAQDTQAIAPNPQAPAAPPTLISTLLVPQGRWAEVFDSNDLASVQCYNLVVLKDALIQLSQRITVLEAGPVVAPVVSPVVPDPNTPAPVEATE